MGTWSHVKHESDEFKESLQLEQRAAEWNHYVKRVSEGPLQSVGFSLPGLGDFHPDGNWHGSQSQEEKVGEYVRWREILGAFPRGNLCRVAAHTPGVWEEDFAEVLWKWVIEWQRNNMRQLFHIAQPEQLRHMWIVPLEAARCWIVPFEAAGMYTWGIVPLAGLYHLRQQEWDDISDCCSQSLASILWIKWSTKWRKGQIGEIYLHTLSQHF